MILNGRDGVQILSLGLRQKRGEVISSNIANSETPGFRAIGFGFEDQLKEALPSAGPRPKVTHPRHLLGRHVSADGQINPEVFVRPTESVGNDGNTVDLDHEMALLAQNQLTYKGVVESISRKIGLLKYAIGGGR